VILRFAHPAAFLLLLLPFIIFALSRWGGWRYSPPLLRYSDLRLLYRLPVGWRVRLRRLPDILRLIAWFVLVLALARPQSGRSQEIIRGQGIDIVLALDISTSMRALDFAPQNRLEAAKEVISDFVAGRQFDRIGLVVFAHNAYHQVPPTLDYDVLLRMLGEVQLSEDLGLQDGTAIGLGLASSANMLRQSDATSKIIILLTDGANNAGHTGPISAAEAAATLGMRVYTIGMGRTGLVPVPIDDAGNTQLVESDVDEVTLQEIADITEARYFRAEDLTSLQSVYDQIDALERTDVERQVFVRWREQAAVLLIAAFALLLIERILRLTVLQTIP
jgi:Ca-activated chloride channel homolog